MKEKHNSNKQETRIRVKIDLSEDVSLSFVVNLQKNKYLK